MFKIKLLLCGLTLFALFNRQNSKLSAQDQTNFNKIFEQETGDKNETIKKNSRFKNIGILSYYPDTLPRWFFSLPASGEEFYALGISDPDMEHEKAKELALIRAKASALIFSNAKIQYYRDIYTSAVEEGKYTNLRQRFDTYFKISASSAINDGMFAVVDTHFTRYNEYIVLVKYTPSLSSENDSINLTAVGTTLLIEASVDDAFEDQAEYELLNLYQPNQGELKKAHYLYREKGSRSLSYSAINNEENEYPVYVYTYASPDWTTARHAFTSYNGLWSIYTRQLLNYLTLNSQQNSIKLKNLGEQYSSELSTLTREIASFTAKLNINGINFDTDTLKLDVQVEEISRLIK